MTDPVRSYVLGGWVEGGAPSLPTNPPPSTTPLYSAVDGTVVTTMYQADLPYAQVCEYARQVGGKALRDMGTIHDRAFAIKFLGQHLLKYKEEFYALSTHTGATRRDSWIDIEGGIGAMFVLSSKARRELTDAAMHVEGASERLSRGGTFLGQHVCVPREGLALCINAFNFPIWGLAEKLAPAIIAGMPVLIKPSPVGAYLAHAFVRRILESGLLPEGAVQFLAVDTPGDLLDHLGPQDSILFTGSAPTGRAIKSHPNVIDKNVRVNIEADSLNASILGPDVTPDDEEFSLFVREVVQEMTVKSGQKCTAIRRSIVPSHLLEEVRAAIHRELSEVRTGHPGEKETQMGPLASILQRERFSLQLNALLASGDLETATPGLAQELVESGSSAYAESHLMVCRQPLVVDAVHRIEAFGPMTTLLPYKTLEEAIEIANKAQGSLVCSCFTGDDRVAAAVTTGCAPWHGRVHLINRHSAKESTGHGSPMPHMVHGGPGRAGGGEEQGGARAVLHLMQRTALQGSPTTLMHVTGHYIKGASTTQAPEHPFRLHFEDLTPGMHWITPKRTLTEQDVEDFGSLSGDRFYAHFNEKAAAASLFGRRVAHGYLVLSVTAGLFVHPDPGPVLLNYGLEGLEFLLPVDFGDTLQAKLIVKRKTRRQKRTTDPIPYGIVYWAVEVDNQRGERVAEYTILTLVRRREAMRWDEVG